MNDIQLPDPDITWDLDRIKEPTTEPTMPPTNIPMTVTTNNPTYPPTKPTQPLSLEPTQSFTTLASEIVPTTSPPSQSSTLEPTSSDNSGTATPLPTQPPTEIVTPPQESSQGKQLTYFSCPPPTPEIIESVDENGNPVTITLEAPISKVVIDYDFELQLKNNADVRGTSGGDAGSSGSSVSGSGLAYMQSLLPEIENRLGFAVANYMKQHTENGQDETTCGGYYVEEFRRRRRQRADASFMDGIWNGGPQQSQQAHFPIEHYPASTTYRQATNDNSEFTKIISIISDDYRVDQNQVCSPPNDDCFVINGQLEATYVGYNEASVKSAISRLIKTEMDTSSSTQNKSDNGGQTVDINYEMKYLGPQNDGQARAANTPAAAIEHVS